ncbi:MAG: vitamin K epoxide reductase family protein [Armatimonadetes bacterium]|nr:vitamin K epoxide reductase family protein [Armatimonadota bacterium]
MNARMANRIIFFLSILGLGVAGFLWYAHVTGVNIPCGATNDCEAVNSSPWATVGGPNGLPTSALGFGLYLLIAILAFYRTVANRTGMVGLLVWALVLVGVGVSSWLTWIEVDVLHKICKWCVSSYAILLLMLVVASMERVFVLRGAWK